MNGWIIVSAVNESASPTHFWDGDEWIDYSADATLLNSAAVTTVASGATIEDMRSAKGGFQSQFTDRDVRIAEVSTVVTLGAVIS
jgi:hypothetical protein